MPNNEIVKSVERKPMKSVKNCRWQRHRRLLKTMQIYGYSYPARPPNSQQNRIGPRGFIDAATAVVVNGTHFPTLLQRGSGGYDMIRRGLIGTNEPSGSHFLQSRIPQLDIFPKEALRASFARGAAAHKSSGCKDAGVTLPGSTLDTGDVPTKSKPAHMTRARLTSSYPSAAMISSSNCRRFLHKTCRM